MFTAVMIAGPPTSNSLWTEVQRKLQRRAGKDQEPVAGVELVDLLGAGPAALADAPQSAIDRAASHIAHRVEAVEGPVVLVAHGLAVPAAVRAAALLVTQDNAQGGDQDRSPAGSPLRLVISNGPLAHLDPVTAAAARVCAMPRGLAAHALHPRLILPWLSSSIGLRRAVRNPYVMDRDTVVAICGPVFDSNSRRRAVAEYIASLPDALRSTPKLAVNTLAAWGDEDRLYPPSVVDEARLVLPMLEHRAISGGRFLHPVERPWELADLITWWAGKI